MKKITAYLLLCLAALLCLCLLLANPAVESTESTPPIESSPAPLLIRQPGKNRPGVIACVGDSLTFGVDLAESAMSYPAQLDRMLGADYTAHNFGAGGATLQRHCDWSYWNAPAFQRSVACEPDAVIIMLGTNDTTAEAWTDAKTFAAEYRALVGHYRALPSKPVIYAMTPPSAFALKGQADLRYGLRLSVLAEIVETIRALANQDGLPLIDAYAATAGHSEEYLEDGIHLTAAGYRRVAELACQALGMEEW